MSPQLYRAAAQQRAVAPFSRWQRGQAQVSLGRARGGLADVPRVPEPPTRPRPSRAESSPQPGWKGVRAAVASRNFERFGKVLAASCHIGAEAWAFIEVKEPQPRVASDVPASGGGIGISPLACLRSRGAATREGWSA